MIRLITATPGSGKTLKAIEFIFKDLKAKPIQGHPVRMIYSNIDGLNIPDVLDMPEDWRDCPDGSILYIDEAQMLPQYKKKDLKKHLPELVLKYEEIREHLQIHRHRGFDITFITQFPRLIHSDVIDLVGEHYHLHRAFGLKQATVYLWRYAHANPNTRAAKNECETKSTWLYPTHLYRYYKSATVHTHKSQFPTKYIVVACLIIGVFVLAGYKAKVAASGQGTFVSDSDNKTVTTKTEIKKQEVVKVYKPDERVALVISDGSMCWAKNQYGELLKITQTECMTYSDHPALLSPARDHNADYAQQPLEPAKTITGDDVKPQIVSYENPPIAINQI